MGIEPTALCGYSTSPARAHLSGVLSSPRESPLNPAPAAAHPADYLPIEIVLRHADAVARLLSSLPLAPYSASHSREVRLASCQPKPQLVRSSIGV